MKQSTKIIVSVLVFALFLTGGLLILGRLNIGQFTPKQPTVVPTQNPFKNAPLNPRAQVSLTTQGFIPQTLTLVKGSTLTIINSSNTPQKIVSSQIRGFDSDVLSPQDSYSYTFESLGTFSFYTQSNPATQGIIIVVDNK